MDIIGQNKTQTSEGSTPQARHSVCFSTRNKHIKQKQQDHVRGLVRQARIPVVRGSDTRRMDELTAVATHQPCPECGSSDALTINADGSTKCYSCGIFTPSKNKGDTPTITQSTKMEST